MADYYKIQSLSKKGDIALSRKVFEQIATEATLRISGASISKNNPVTITFRSTEKVEVALSVSISKNYNVKETCQKIQEEVASSLMAYCESIPYEIKIKVVSIG